MGFNSGFKGLNTVLERDQAARFCSVSHIPSVDFSEIQLRKRTNFCVHVRNRVSVITYVLLLQCKATYTIRTGDFSNHLPGFQGALTLRRLMSYIYIYIYIYIWSTHS